MKRNQKKETQEESPMIFWRLVWVLLASVLGDSLQCFKKDKEESCC